jgi:hypothetical protein
MPRVTDIINKGDHIFDSSENEFLRSVKDSEVFIFEELIKILNTLNISGGKLTTNSEAENFLMSMDAKIYNALKKANYDASVLKYTKNFGQIAENAKELQSALNGINITDKQITPFLKMGVNTTIDRLAGSGLAKDFIIPVRDSLYQSILLGSDVSDVEKTLRDFTISNVNGDSKLMKYAGQVARDSMRMFDGTIQQNIANELELNALRYVGSLITDSRKQCIRWVEDRILLLEDLADEIEWAYNNGSGMIPGTTPANFYMNTGGFNCRHRALSTMFYEK